MLDKQEGSTPISSPISIILMNLHQLFQLTNFSNFISVKKAKYRTLTLLMAKTMLKQIKANHHQFKWNLKLLIKWLLWINNIFKRAIKRNNIKIKAQLQPFILISLNKMINILKINN